MTAENLVPCRETCEALASADFPKRTFLAWTQGEDGGWFAVSRPHNAADWFISAPTLAEVLAALPETLTCDGAGPGEPEPVTYEVPWMLMPDGGAYSIMYEVNTEALDNAAEAAARLWLALHREGLLTPAAEVPHE